MCVGMHAVQLSKYVLLSRARDMSTTCKIARLQRGDEKTCPRKRGTKRPKLELRAAGA